MNPAILNSPFIQVALPIVVTLIVAWRVNGKRFDDFKVEVHRRFDEVIKRLGRIKTSILDHDVRMVRLEERTSPLSR